MNAPVLVLNQSYEPLSVCNVKKAILLLIMDKAEIVEHHSNKILRSISSSVPFPSVIKLYRYISLRHSSIELSRKNLQRRDSYKCQYCSKSETPLTIDHILPKSRGGLDTWDNLVSACVQCNNKKGNKTPKEAGMTLLSVPKKPHYIMYLKTLHSVVETLWRPYLFMD